MEEKISKLAPSILSADFCKLGEQIHELEECDIELLHIDVMDGEFVPSISFGMPVIKSIRKITDMFFDVHLMVNEPVRYVEDFAKCGADLLTVHYEACKDVRATDGKNGEDYKGRASILSALPTIVFISPL